MEKIGIDLDSVVCNLDEVIDDYLKSRWNLHLKEKRFVNFDFERNPYFSRPVVEDLMSVVHTGDFLAQAKPYHYSLSSLHDLYTKGFEIHIITGRRERLSGAATRKWLEDHALLHNELHFTNGISKEKLAHELGLTAFIEDNFDTITGVLNACGPMKYGIYVVDHQWNRYYYNKHVLRVDTFEEAVDNIIELKEKFNE